MPYLKKRGNNYSYSRRIPSVVSKYYPLKTERIVIALHTDSETIAERRSLIINEDVENYWKGLVNGKASHSKNNFNPVFETAKLLGFDYKPSHELAQEPTPEIVSRLLSIGQLGDNPELIQAKLGGAEIETTSVPLSEALEIYWNISKHLTIGKSETQIRKWRNPRIKAVNNLIQVSGDKSIKDLVRNDILALRDWWIDRIETQGKKANSANKDLIYVKNIVSDVTKHQQFNIDVKWLFDEISLKDDSKSERLPFKIDFIQNELLNPKYHEDLNDDAKYLLYSMADLGARPNELIGLDPKDIILDAEIPHIKIRTNKHRNLKTKESERDLPLVGCALWAFRQLPNGFERYRSKKSGADSVSALLMKHLRTQKLLPTENHVLYSLRHSFQDRLTCLGVPDRIQCQLMGHVFKDRIQYGQGADLAKKKEWLKKMCFTPPSE